MFKNMMEGVQKSRNIHILKLKCYSSRGPRQLPDPRYYRAMYLQTKEYLKYLFAVSISSEAKRFCLEVRKCAVCNYINGS